MANFLVCTTEAAEWRIDPVDFGDWLLSQWADVVVDERIGSAQRQHLWAWRDGCEVWLPADLDCCWISADVPVVAAIAVRLALTGPSDLILCDEGYNIRVPLSGTSAAEIVAAL